MGEIVYVIVRMLEVILLTSPVSYMMHFLSHVFLGVLTLLVCTSVV